MSQAELARRTGIRPTTINEIYWELIERINLEHIDLICKELGCTIQDFMELNYEAEDELRERVKSREKYCKKI